MFLFISLVLDFRRFVLRYPRLSNVQLYRIFRRFRRWTRGRIPVTMGEGYFSRPAGSSVGLICGRMCVCVGREGQGCSVWAGVFGFLASL
ncbi:hypothetical protein M406DRAFT_100671 [Cryphonectria parasitica EP155]|uniref:Uncharacterized protein n=1 Tax=Cryphonectria parasitica (strain ATCC 38755 / EP155) TaxID=660469 RepID=A0A9P5CUF7_CRYP1|nr:uncharacterized protein M406DRAFT_100671 [Cryphonectria parasitica EP155]KAF3770030.1 hypothetical protein M406DRAFT_100671 [Cryphonectria parasitica EP155]